MNLRPRFAPLVLLLASCSSAEPPAERTTLTVGPVEVAHAQPSAPPGDDGSAGFIVWATDHDGHRTSYRLDDRGEELEEHPGVLIAVGGDVWTLRQRSEEVSVAPCARFEDSADDEHPELEGEVDPGHVTRLSLALEGSETEQIVIDGDIESEGAAELEHGARLIASVGPYLFLEQTLYAYSCGAHGHTTVSSVVWDAASKTGVEPAAELGPLDAPRAAAMAELEDDDGYSPATPENTELTALVPRFESDGALRLGLQFTAPTCYACTRGGWSSYTKSVAVDAPALPAALVAYATAPDAVRAFIAAHPRLAIGGWSRVAR